MLNQEMLQTLAVPREGTAVSIYSPTHDSGNEAVGDPIWLKRGLQKAEKIMKERQMAPELIERVLKPARSFRRDMAPNDFGAGALCCLLADGIDEIMHSPRQIPEELVVVGDRFHLKPLIPTLTDNAHFYVLAISRHHVRLLQCTRYTQETEPLSRQQVPQHILEVIPESEPKKSLQFHTSKAQAGGHGDHEAAFHGHEALERVERHQIRRFFREVTKGIAMYMNGRSPLIFAGVGELFPHYRQVNTYDHLVDEPILGNPEHLRPEELREQAWEILEPRFHGRLAEIKEKFEASLAHSKATDDMAKVAPAARDGRVGVLIGAVDEDCWGRVAEDGEDVVVRSNPEPGDYELVDYAAVQTMLQGGEAFLVSAEQVPGEIGPAAAILRY